MRPRTKKHFDERYARVNSLLAERPIDTEDRRFTGLRLEIGCGKGAFVTGMAKLYPEVRFVALEVVPSVILMAMEKVFDDPVLAAQQNVGFILDDARRLREYFPENSLDAIYLNFSDPWPRPKHYKNRLTHPDFLAVYRALLKPGAVLSQKTDNADLFEYSVLRLSEAGFEVKVLDAAPENNVMTEYERRFTELGQPIYRLTACCIK